MENDVAKLFTREVLAKLNVLVTKIREALSLSALKKIDRLIAGGLKAESFEKTRDAYRAVILEVLKSVKQANYLAANLVSGVDAEVVVGVFEESLKREWEGARYCWGLKRYLAFNDGQKEALVDRILSESEGRQVFPAARYLMKYAGAMPLICQQKLFGKYLELLPENCVPLPVAIERKKNGLIVRKELVGSADLIYVYDAWQGLDGALRKQLRNLIAMALHQSMMQFRDIRENGVEVVRADGGGGEDNFPDRGAN